MSILFEFLDKQALEEVFLVNAWEEDLLNE